MVGRNMGMALSNIRIYGAQRPTRKGRLGKADSERLTRIGDPHLFHGDTTTIYIYIYIYNMVGRNMGMALSNIRMGRVAHGHFLSMAVPT